MDTRAKETNQLLNSNPHGKLHVYARCSKCSSVGYKRAVGRKSFRMKCGKCGHVGDKPTKRMHQVYDSQDFPHRIDVQKLKDLAPQADPAMLNITEGIEHIAGHTEDEWYEKVVKANPANKVMEPIFIARNMHFKIEIIDGWHRARLWTDLGFDRMPGYFFPDHLLKQAYMIGPQYVTY